MEQRRTNNVVADSQSGLESCRECHRLSSLLGSNITDTLSPDSLHISFQHNHVHSFTMLHRQTNHCLARGIFPLNCSMQDGVCPSSFRSHHMSKPSELHLINDLQQCVILRNVFCNSPVYLCVGRMRGVMHMQVLCIYYFQLPGCISP